MKVGGFSRVVFPPSRPELAYKYTTPESASVEVVALKRLADCETVIALLAAPATVTISTGLQMTRLVLPRMEMDLLQFVHHVDGTEPQRLSAMRQIVAAVEAMHGLKVAHMDLKLENVLVDTSGDEIAVRVSDFGLAVVDEDHSAARTGAARGSMAYVAPEVLDERCAWNPYRADMYSLGVLVYALFFVAFPYSAPQTSDLKYVQFYFGQVHEHKEALTALEKIWPSLKTKKMPDEARALVNRCMHVDPNKRASFVG